MSLSKLKGVGPSVLAKLHKLGVFSLYDLLLQLPLRYEDRQTPVKIRQLQPQQSALVFATVQSAQIVMGRKRSLLVQVTDDTGRLGLRFYHFTQGQKAQFTTGSPIKLFGEIKNGATGLEVYHPEYELGDNRHPYNLQLEQTDYYTPIYPLTEGLTQIKLRQLHQQVYAQLQTGQMQFDELSLNALNLPNLPSLKDALLFIHAPPKSADLSLLQAFKHPAQIRLIAEELLAQQLAMLNNRAKWQQDSAPPCAPSQQLAPKLQAQLPFCLTPAQQRVIAEIQQDLHQDKPMLRLLQGDVGAGKTLVAAFAACCALEAGYQVALMAPTELLAEQLFQHMHNWFTPHAIHIGWLSGKSKGKARNSTLAALRAGQIQLLVGTHALFQAEVQFYNLALVIIDEQHRFGVHQRLSLREKGQTQGLTPHQLIMTATPIPRTLAMSAYADLSLSVIDQLPPNRTPISTATINQARRADVIQRIGQVCKQSQQAYWVCTLIEESEVLQCEAAEDSFKRLQQSLPQLRIALVHGRMKSAEKTQIMQDFKTHKYDLLVATTVIEVGVDVPNASLMIIENPERLGLSQLHQLRGRVGRGSLKSHCILLYSAPLSFNAKQRLSILKQSQDGFFIAEQDLKLRGPGELLGTKQTGLAQLKIANLERDAQLLAQIQPYAQTLMRREPQQVAQILQRWIGESERFFKA